MYICMYILFLDQMPYITDCKLLTGIRIPSARVLKLPSWCLKKTQIINKYIYIMYIQIIVLNGVRCSFSVLWIFEKINTFLIELFTIR